jgi:DNA-binding response OmpR family regulator
MSNRVLLVESEPTHSLIQALESRGFAVESLTDATRCVEQVRQQPPDLVLLSVDLAAGQNGYLVCGKLKKDDALKHLPVVIVGNPDGFAAHRKLKAHADEYVGTPVEPGLLADRVAAVLAASSELHVQRTRVVELLQHYRVDARVDAAPAQRHVREPERAPLPLPERRGPSVLWMLIGLLAVAGGAWMVWQGITREGRHAPLPASNVQP